MKTTGISLAILLVSLVALNSGAQAASPRDLPQLSTTNFYDLTHPQDPIGPIWDGYARVERHGTTLSVQPKHRIPQLDPHSAQSLIGN